MTVENPENPFGVNICSACRTSEDETKLSFHFIFTRVICANSAIDSAVLAYELDKHVTLSVLNDLTTMGKSNSELKFDVLAFMVNMMDPVITR